MILIAEQCIAIFFVNRILKKLMTETTKGVAKIYNHTALNSLQIFTDPTMHRQKRAGLYAWLDLADDEIATSIDWPLGKGILPAEDVMGYAIIYAKAVAAHPQNYIEVTEDQLEKAVDG